MSNNNVNQSIVPFWYVVSSGSMVASGAADVSLQLAADSDFECHGILGSCTLDTDTDVMPNNFTVLITDNTTGRQLSNLALPQRIICAPANGGFYRLFRPVRFVALSVLRIQFTNLDGGNANTVTLALQGAKIIL